jgi:hypothetical protein
MVSPPGEGPGEITYFFIENDRIEAATPSGSKITLQGPKIKVEAETICLCAKSKLSMMAPEIEITAQQHLLMGAKSGNVDIKGGPLVRIHQLVEMTPAVLKAMIESRIEQLKNAGLTPNNTDTYDAIDAIGTVVGNPANRAQIEAMAARYGIPPQLLAGVMAAEMDLDHEFSDKVQDWWARKWNARLPGVDAVGLSSVHGDTLQTAIKYLQDNNLPGASYASGYDASAGNMASFDGATEAGAIVTSMYLHAKGGAPTPKDMAVLWGGYRAGVEGVSPSGNGYSLDGFRNNVANGTDKLPAQFRVGTNAYMSEPLFEYLELLWSLPTQCCE